MIALHLDVPTWTNGGGLVLTVLVLVVVVLSAAWMRGVR